MLALSFACFATTMTASMHGFIDASAHTDVSVIVECSSLILSACLVFVDEINHSSRLLIRIRPCCLC